MEWPSGAPVRLGRSRHAAQGGPCVEDALLEFRPARRALRRQHLNSRTTQFVQCFRSHGGPLPHPNHQHRGSVITMGRMLECNLDTASGPALRSQHLQQERLDHCTGDNWLDPSNAWSGCSMCTVHGMTCFTRAASHLLQAVPMLPIHSRQCGR